MAISSLAGLYIDQTYQRVVQTNSLRNEFADGLGNPIPFLTNNTATGSYGSFYDTGSYVATSATTIYSMSFSNTDISNGVYISGSTNPNNTYIKFANAGVYNIQFSAQFSNNDNSGQDVVIWLRKNDNSSINDLADSTGTVTIPPRKGATNGQIIASWNYFVTVAPNDYMQLLWHAPIANAITLETLPSGSNPQHPRSPSVILTVNRVDQFLSNTGSFSGSFTGVFTGSLQGTASWANNALTASFYQETDPIFTSRSASLATTGSNTFNGNQTISGSFTVFTGSAIEFQVLNTGVRIGNTLTDIHNVTGSLRVNGSITGSLLGTSSFATSASFATTSSLSLRNIITASVSSNTITFTKGDGTTFPITVNTGSGGGSTTPGGSPGQIQYNNENSFGGVSALTFNGSLVTATNISATGSFNGTINATGDFSGNVISSNINATGSLLGNFTGNFISSVFNNIALSYPDPPPVPEPPLPVNEISGSCIYVVTYAGENKGGESKVPMIFTDPALYTGQRATVINRDQSRSIDINNANGFAAVNKANTVITTIASNTTVEFISTGTQWIQL